MITLARLEALLDDARVAKEIEHIEAELPVGVRPRQLCVRTLLLGMFSCQAEGRPAHLRRVHGALVGLGLADQTRLGVRVEWKSGTHTLTYRQVEYVFSLVAGALNKETPDGTPSPMLGALLDPLVEASVAAAPGATSSSLALDWTDVESYSTRRTKADGNYADVEASWGHRKGGGPGERDELFFGYYLSLATVVAEERGPDVAELVRRMVLTSCGHDQVRALVARLGVMVASGVDLGDVVADSGYAHRVPESFALPVRAMGAHLVMDLHPHDRGTRGTEQGAICWNGNLYCPATPRALFDLEPLGRRAGAEEIAAHDRRSAELARHKLGRISADDDDGYHRMSCPAVTGKVRCPLRANSMALGYERPEILAPPEHPPCCCRQQSITIAPSVNAKSRQKHDYPSPAHRRSYARRTAVERSNSRIKDPATVDIARGWCRLMGLVPMSLFLSCALVARNLAVTDAFEARQDEERRRLAAGLPPRTRHRRRRSIADLIDIAPANAPP